MRIVKKVINRKKNIFAVRLDLDADTDDIWNVYNLINVGDLITGTCNRKIQQESSGLTKVFKKKFTVTIQVKTFQYDAENDSLRINGICARENAFIGMGMSQSMDIKPPRQIAIIKRVFDSVHIARFK